MPAKVSALKVGVKYIEIYKNNYFILITTYLPPKKCFLISLPEIKLVIFAKIKNDFKISSFLQNRTFIKIMIEINRDNNM